MTCSSRAMLIRMAHTYGILEAIFVTGKARGKAVKGLNRKIFRKVDFLKTVDAKVILDMF